MPASEDLQSCPSFSTPVSTPVTSTSVSSSSHDLARYIALGCLHLDKPLDIINHDISDISRWTELSDQNLHDEARAIIGDEAARLLDARWIRLFFHRQSNFPRLIRVYLLPEDWGRRTIDRASRNLKAALRQLLHRIDISSEAWSGKETVVEYFDPWASAENVSLYYIFNKLPSPTPSVEKIKSRYGQKSLKELLASSQPVLDHGANALDGINTWLYPYQARSASLMIQRETAPQLQLDPRLEKRQSPNGETFYFGARDGSFLQEPRFYESTRGGILAETMGLGKTIICLSVILATKGHLPRIPSTYQPLPPVRNRIGSLVDMAAGTIARHSIPAKAILERKEIEGEAVPEKVKSLIDSNFTFYEIPPELPRMNRNTRIPPPQQLVMCSGTIVVVPRNLLQQWQIEIRKHVYKGSLKILIVDSVSKRNAKAKPPPIDDMGIEFCSDLPVPTELMKYDVVLFSRSRFEQEIPDTTSRPIHSAPVSDGPFIGDTKVPDYNFTRTNAYESPLKKLHWLRVIIDEGHSFSSSVSNAVLVAKQFRAERRWVVSGTPAKNLVGVEVDLSSLDENTDPSVARELAIEQRRKFSLDEENTKAARALGTLASHFLMVRPWSDSPIEGRLDWEEYIYRHENQYRKTNSGFSACFLRTLEGLVVKTRPDDVEKDIILPPMKHRVVYLKPCWWDKMTANMFIQVLRANAITSERTDVDYLFHKNSIKARHSLIRNLRQSNFTWTGFSIADVKSTLKTTGEYLQKDDKTCSAEDTNSLLESSNIVGGLAHSQGWIDLSKAHEVGMAVENWPKDSEDMFSLGPKSSPSMIGVTQLLEGQLHVDSHILSEHPAKGLGLVGQAAQRRLEAIEKSENEIEDGKNNVETDAQMTKTGVPSSCVGGQPITSRRTTVANTRTSTPNTPPRGKSSKDSSDPAGPSKKRKLTLSDEMAELAADSSLRDTRVVGTTSAKLSYLVEKVMRHQEEEKIIIFYDGDNAAFYIAQCLEMLYVNHRIYARTLDNTKRSEYVALFNEDPDIRVLLIDVACGALGLNLNAASVVLIVNPINRPGIEAQAIKRAHRIGQTREVLVETLVLEGGIEEAIFKKAKNMSRKQHMEAKELEDDAGIVEIIQNAKVFPIDEKEAEGKNQFALLETPQQVFGRPNRHKFHRYGHDKNSDKPKKKAKTTAKALVVKATEEESTKVKSPGPYPSPVPILGSSLVQQPPRPRGNASVGEDQETSLFGNGSNIGSGEF